MALKPFYRNLLKANGQVACNNDQKLRVIVIKMGSDCFATGLGEKPHDNIVEWNATHEGMSAVFMHTTKVYSSLKVIPTLCKLLDKIEGLSTTQIEISCDAMP